MRNKGVDFLLLNSSIVINSLFMERIDLNAEEIADKISIRYVDESETNHL